MGNPFLGTLTLWGAAQAHTASCRDTLLDLLWERAKSRTICRASAVYSSAPKQALFKAVKEISLKT